MFRRLRIQFIVAATVAVIVMLISVICILNASKYAVSENRINKILDLLSENGGVLPDEDIVEKILGRKTTSVSDKFAICSVFMVITLLLLSTCALKYLY